METLEALGEEARLLEAETATVAQPQKRRDEWMATVSTVLASKMLGLCDCAVKTCGRRD